MGFVSLNRSSTAESYSETLFTALEMSVRSLLDHGS